MAGDDIRLQSSCFSYDHFKIFYDLKLIWHKTPISTVTYTLASPASIRVKLSKYEATKLLLFPLPKYILG